MESFEIDIKKIIRSRKGGERIPGFILDIFARFIHQDFLNVFLRYGYKGVDFAKEGVKYLDVKSEVKGLENLDLLPERKPCTFVSNHPLGGIDGVILIDLLYRNTHRDIRLLVNDFLLNIKGLAPLCVGVNMLGSQSRSLSTTVHRTFDSDSSMLLFPAGICSRKYNGIIQDRPWKKTFYSESERTGRYIVPIHFISRNSWRFYFVDRMCRFFHIKANLAMALLPDELYRGRHSTVKVVIGKPLPPHSFNPSKSDYDCAQEIRKLVYTLE